MTPDEREVLEGIAQVAREMLAQRESRRRIDQFVGLWFVAGGIIFAIRGDFGTVIMLVVWAAFLWVLLPRIARSAKRAGWKQAWSKALALASVNGVPDEVLVTMNLASRVEPSGNAEEVETRLLLAEIEARLAADD